MTKGELKELLRSLKDLPDNTKVFCPGYGQVLYPAKYEVLGDKIVIYPDDRD
jgi:hypothetical protein